MNRSIPLALLLIASLLAGCLPPANAAAAPVEISEPSPTPLPTLEVTPAAARPHYLPGELVEYTVQTGDTLTALAARFNTTIEEIRAANPVLPARVTLLPPGMPMQIPIYYLALWGSPYQILPDALFINGPAQVGFDVTAFVDSQPGWLKTYQGNIGISPAGAAEIIADVALTYSISPRLLLALVEYHSQGLSNPEPPASANDYPLGEIDSGRRGLYSQLIWAANTLNDLYYSYRMGRLTQFTHPDGRLERPDPWQNAASAALQAYFSRQGDAAFYTQATGPNGLALTYAHFFGDPWVTQPHLPGSLEQPALRLPFEAGKTWAFTGGPHTGWGEGEPLAAIDFAPPSIAGGCVESGEWATAVADGVIARAEPGLLVLDLDGDADERTGWTVFYLHLQQDTNWQVGQAVTSGAPLGHPSCERGKSTGTHVHIARKYNGEWILATGDLAFNLEGWVAFPGSEPYQGSLVQGGHTVIACVCSDRTSFIRSQMIPNGIVP